MYDKQQLCERIKSFIPEMGEGGVDVQVDFNTDLKSWVVDVTKDTHHLATYLEPEDADECMESGKCVGLAFKIQQLRTNIDKV